MSYAPLSSYPPTPAGGDERDLDYDIESKFRRRPPTLFQLLATKSAQRLLAISAASALLLLVVFAAKGPSRDTLDLGLTDPAESVSEVPSGQAALDFVWRKALPFIQTDGEPVKPHRGAVEASWPEGYPKAASYLETNSVLRDADDPWPEKPWIKNVWLSPSRFPDGLHGQPYRNRPRVALEEMQERQNLPPGLHDPPLPKYPRAQDYKPLHRPPRESLYQARDWHPPKGGMKMPQRTRSVQAKQFPQAEERKELTQKRRDWVKRAFLHAWEAYKANAFGHDEVTPLTGSQRNGYNAWGATTIDALDLLLMINLTHEYNVARTHVRNVDITFLAEEAGCNGKAGPVVHLFENVIRYLGGFLSAYDLSGDDLMLERAKDLAEWLLPAFSTSSGWPIPFYKLGLNPAGSAAPRILAAEVGSLSMELTRLSQRTGDDTYYHLALRIQDRLSRYKSQYGSLVPYHLQDDFSSMGEPSYAIGGMIDSYYEYEIKMVQVLGDTESVFGRMYRRAIDDMYRYLVVNVTVTPDRTGLVFVGQRAGGPEGSHRARIRAVQEHLSCFAGGMFGLGGRLLGRKQDLATAIELTESAVWSYQSTATGVMPEIMEFYAADDPSRWRYSDDNNGDGTAPTSTATQKGLPLGASSQTAMQYQGRPEAIESVFYMYRITGDPVWQDYGWRMFGNWVKHAIAPYGFANIHDVNKNPPPLEDIQESFVLAETLKYYYLLFSPPDLISLDDYVFNTEAHPFRLPFTKPSHLWPGPELEVDLAYSDPRDHHLFRASAQPSEIPFGRGTAEQQQYRAEHCSPQ